MLNLDGDTGGVDGWFNENLLIRVSCDGDWSQNKFLGHTCFNFGLVVAFNDLGWEGTEAQCGLEGGFNRSKVGLGGVSLWMGVGLGCWVCNIFFRVVICYETGARKVSGYGHCGLWVGLVVVMGGGGVGWGLCRNLEGGWGVGLWVSWGTELWVKSFKRDYSLWVRDS